MRFIFFIAERAKVPQSAQSGYESKPPNQTTHPFECCNWGNNFGELAGNFSNVLVCFANSLCALR